MFEAFIIFGGFWFWSLFLIESFLLIYCLEEDKVGFAIFLTILGFVIFWVWGDFIKFKWVIDNPGSIVVAIGFYILIGTIYSFLKYFFYLTDMRRKWDRAFTEYCEKIADIKGADKLKFSELPEGYQKACSDHINNRLGYSSLPTFSESTGQVIFWMCYWPWSLFWTILNNPLKWAFEEIKRGLIGFYRKMHTKIIGDRYDAMKEWKDRN